MRETDNIGKALGVTHFLAKKFDLYAFEDEWLETFGQVEKNFKACIYGKPGHGKTEMCIKLAKYLTRFGTVLYNSFEQGISKTLQSSIERNNLDEVNGKITFGDKITLTQLYSRLARKKSADIVFIDSRDYMGITAEDYSMLTEQFPRKAFVIICWQEGSRPAGKAGREIEYMADIKVMVKDFIALPRSRFGGNKPFVIWDRGTKLEELENTFTSLEEDATDAGIQLELEFNK